MFYSSWPKAAKSNALRIQTDTMLQQCRVQKITNFPRIPSTEAAQRWSLSVYGHVLCKHTRARAHTRTRTHNINTHTLTPSLGVYTCYPTPRTHSCAKGKVCTSQSKNAPRFTPRCFHRYRTNQAFTVLVLKGLAEC